MRSPEPFSSSIQEWYWTQTRSTNPGRVVKNFRLFPTFFRLFEVVLPSFIKIESINKCWSLTQDPFIQLSKQLWRWYHQLCDRPTFIIWCPTFSDFFPTKIVWAACRPYNTTCCLIFKTLPDLDRSWVDPQFTCVTFFSFLFFMISDSTEHFCPIWAYTHKSIKIASQQAFYVLEGDCVDTLDQRQPLPIR